MIMVNETVCEGFAGATIRTRAQTIKMLEILNKRLTRYGGGAWKTLYNFISLSFLYVGSTAQQMSVVIQKKIQWSNIPPLVTL